MTQEIISNLIFSIKKLVDLNTINPSDRGLYKLVLYYYANFIKNLSIKDYNKNN